MFQHTPTTPLPAPPPLVAASHSLLLDFDGTLVALAAGPDAIEIDDALATLLHRLVGTFGGRVALVSGRSVAQLDGFLGDAVSAMAVVGSHGAETRHGGAHILPARPDALVAAETAIRDRFGQREGVVIEIKSLGVGIHYRMSPDAETEARAIAAELGQANGLAVQEGKMMVELRVAGHDKGSGITALMQQPPFAGTTPIFLGDDVTDEAGFAAVANLGGFGVLVGEARPTAASYLLPSVQAVREWLGTAA